MTTNTNYMQRGESVAKYCQVCGVKIVTSYLRLHAKFHGSLIDEIYFWEKDEARPKGNTDVTNIDVTDTINGLPRKLVQEVEHLLKEFWVKQPGWGDAAVEGHYAMKIINLVRGKIEK